VLSASILKVLGADHLFKDLCFDLIRGKEDLAGCAQISYPLRSWIHGLVHVRRLEETNKEEEELVDISPHWGEPHILC
jgi:hypothetical protein